jgi:hypothetical protein
MIQMAVKNVYTSAEIWVNNLPVNFYEQVKKWQQQLIWNVECSTQSLANKMGIKRYKMLLK